jgi:molybdopterin/thiamine biosynthesis adenylyltransferase
MAHLIQVGAGSGGMPVLDMLARDPRITHVTLIEPDIYKPHNVERHLFPLSAVGEPKAELAERWLKERRPDLNMRVLQCDLLAPEAQHEIETSARSADMGICAADNEPAKFHFDALMRQAGKPWTLGEVLSGGIGGFVHWFVPGGPCYGCVASHLKRAVTVEKPKAPDYSQPGGAVAETTVPASMASIHAIASLQALITLKVLQATDAKPQAAFDFTSLLLTLERVPDVFEEPVRPYKFRIPRLDDCLICRAPNAFAALAAEDLDVALDQALARLGND